MDPERSPAPFRHLRESGAIRLSWLILLRWLAPLGQLLTILVVERGLGVPLPMGPLLTVIGLEIASNLLLDQWFRRRRRQGLGPMASSLAERVQVLVMITDTVLLMVLLYQTGGLENPFAAFLAVHIVMAAVMLPERQAWTGTLVVFAGLIGLYFFHREVPELVQDPRLRRVGRVIALGATMGITVVFVTRVTRALALRSRELEQEREYQARRERLEALGTLAAGAAHELATPLSTIAVVAKELERGLEGKPGSDEELEDVRLVREEVARCRRILDRMSLDAGDRVGETLEELSVDEVIDEVLFDFPAASRVSTRVEASAEGERLVVPPEALAMALRNLLSNALDASADEASVKLLARRWTDGVEFLVIDRGEGMDEEQSRRASDPFFTTKEPGQGMGLGLFLARSVAERMGGELSIDSTRGRGTTVKVRLPLGPRARDGAAG